MSVAIRAERPFSSEFPSSFAPHVLCHPAPQEIEAPERAELEREAPESRESCVVEAPDAGEGRVALLEHEFTHGRSQS